jgi:ubiquitin carboxyl-terminal hydrolase 8
MYLSVPIPNNLLRQPNLEQCVQEFTKEEILDNEDKWNCPRCRSQQRAKKKIDIWKLPSILIVHLKRFEFSETKKGKIKDYVDFPIKNLDLTPNVSKLQRDKPIYDLFAVCNHEGFLGGGHYYAYTKHRHNQSWY